ncbi:hypothetical protein [Pseudomonas sp. CGJS7]|uniref:hypothetical protein n=1 Tax=Pseudomonas sp. CGJS7 TaxID=3109348 RepID=UPI00300A8B0D
MRTVDRSAPRIQLATMATARRSKSAANPLTEQIAALSLRPDRRVHSSEYLRIALERPPALPVERQLSHHIHGETSWLPARPRARDSPHRSATTALIVRRILARQRLMPLPRRQIRVLHVLALGPHIALGRTLARQRLMALPMRRLAALIGVARFPASGFVAHIGRPLRTLARERAGDTRTLTRNGLMAGLIACR